MTRLLAVSAMNRSPSLSMTKPVGSDSWLAAEPLTPVPATSVPSEAYVPVALL